MPLAAAALAARVSPMGPPVAPPHSTAPLSWPTVAGVEALPATILARVGPGAPARHFTTGAPPAPTSARWAGASAAVGPLARTGQAPRAARSTMLAWAAVAAVVATA